jgi:PiT family inorganic phosphate transporter
LSSSHFGLPLSTTYVATGSIVGAGVASPPHRVRWSLLGRVGVAWLITLPAAGVCGALAFWGESMFGLDAGVIVIGAVVVAYCAAIYSFSRKNAVTASNVNDPWVEEIIEPEPLKAAV